MFVNKLLSVSLSTDNILLLLATLSLLYRPLVNLESLSISTYSICLSLLLCPSLFPSLHPPLRTSISMRLFMPISLSLPSSSVQHECIPQALLGMDIICQAKSGKVNFFLILCCENIVQSLSSVLLMRYKYEIFISLTVLLLLFPSSSLYSSQPHLTVSDHEFEISVCASYYTESTLVLQFWNLLNISSFFYHFVSIFPSWPSHLLFILFVVFSILKFPST